MKIESINKEVQEKVMQLLFDLLRARADRRERAAALRAALRQRMRVAAVMAHEPSVDGVIRQRNAAPRARRRLAALDADEAAAVAAAVEKQDRLPVLKDILAQALLHRTA